MAYPWTDDAKVPQFKSGWTISSISILKCFFILFLFKHSLGSHTGRTVPQGALLVLELWYDQDHLVWFTNFDFGIIIDSKISVKI